MSHRRAPRVDAHPVRATALFQISNRVQIQVELSITNQTRIPDQYWRGLAPPAADHGIGIRTRLVIDVSTRMGLRTANAILIQSNLIGLRTRRSRSSDITENNGANGCGNGSQSTIRRNTAVGSIRPRSRSACSIGSALVANAGSVTSPRCVAKFASGTGRPTSAVSISTGGLRRQKRESSSNTDGGTERFPEAVQLIPDYAGPTAIRSRSWSRITNTNGHRRFNTNLIANGQRQWSSREGQ